MAVDPVQELKHLVKGLAECASMYGGIAIKVKEPTNFPWNEVFRRLLSMGHEVWVQLEEGDLVIYSRPPTE
ncbi:MAG: DUF3292 domain-containing protein [Thaumarchaeota archaeon]|nr:DUF3292 domain-containing protein [Candidatus Calditenuaceae archaeon]MDW8187204.1 hypothetical protein [Nitrososphaerota archaeon]